MLSVFDEAILMSTHNIHFQDKICPENPDISLNICFVEMSEEFPRN